MRVSVKIKPALSTKFGLGITFQINLLNFLRLMDLKTWIWIPLSSSIACIGMCVHGIGKDCCKRDEDKHLSVFTKMTMPE